MFKKAQLKQLQDHGIQITDIEKQIKNFIHGFEYAQLIKPATISDGISLFEESEIKELAHYYDENSKIKKIIKFVPASGAASRMFKDLFSFLEYYAEGQKESIKPLLKKEFKSINDFIENLNDFAFYHDLVEVMKKNGVFLDDTIQTKEFHIIIDCLLGKQGLNYGQLPKGLLKFHKYKDFNRTPSEEHLVEAALYGKSRNGMAKIHFTISPEHRNLFNKHIEHVKRKYEDEFQIGYEIEFSEQKKSTDTIAVDMNNEAFLDLNRNLVFRPGGHGALIENLNDLNGDIIFIKNIDNVVPDSIKEQTTLYKKAIAGILLQKQKKIFAHLAYLENGQIDNINLSGIAKFAEEELNVLLPESFEQWDKIKKKDYLFNHLNKPIRVCGMVKNEGEPGGGPFWVKNPEGEISLQIIESSQIDQNDEEQKQISQSATHFNPVDLVCGITDFKGQKFNLLKFVDPRTGFISIKSKDGKELKAQELPGLWNGAMANWITIFVEVPIITFNPVKTIHDLLRETHR